MKKQYTTPSAYVLDMLDTDTDIIATSESMPFTSNIQVQTKTEAWDDEYDLAKSIKFEEGIENW